MRIVCLPAQRSLVLYLLCDRQASTATLPLSCFFSACGTCYPRYAVVVSAFLIMIYCLPPRFAYIAFACPVQTAGLSSPVFLDQ